MTRRFTAAEIEKLTEGTPPGPWHHIGNGYLETNSEEPLNGVIDWDGAILPDCGDLAAAAPELAAEHHRIITDLEGLLDVVKHETWLYDDEGQFPETVQLGNYVVDQITRILEGDTE